MDKAVHIAMSTIAHGSMSAAVSDGERLANRRRFLEANGLVAEQTILVGLKYEGDEYRRYSVVTSGQAGDGILRPSSITADALFTTDKGLTLLLPVADCVAAVLYDPVGVLGLAHLGRHNLMQDGGSTIVRFMTERFGSDPATIQVWLSPAAGKASYPLHERKGRGLQEESIRQLAQAGVPRAAITIDRRDTTIDASLFSHSQFLRGERTLDGRQAVIATLLP